MSGKRDIVQRLATGQLTDLERRGYSEENIQFATENPELEIKKKVSFAFNQTEKLAIYQEIKDRVVKGMTPDAISRAVIACMEEHLKEKEKEAYGISNSQMNGDMKKGGFRRAE